MAASRDDFIIAIRSAFLKKGNKQRFSLIGLIFFSLGLLIISKVNLPFNNYIKITLNEIVYRTSFIISVPEKKIQDFSAFWKYLIFLLGIPFDPDLAGIIQRIFIYIYY